MKKDSEVSKGYAVFFLLLIGVVVWWKVSYPSYSFHYKITVEIETPEGVKSGSAVREVTVSRQPKIGDAPSVIFGVRGEAVVVDLGGRGVVFSLINWDSDRDVYNAFQTMDNKKLKVGLKGTLPQENYPQFVMFKDMKDPTSVTLVRGGRFNAQKQDFDPVDDFEEIFGASVKLKQITVEITDEPVTRGIEKVLPVTYDDVITKGWQQLNEEEKIRLVNLTTFKTGM